MVFGGKKKKDKYLKHLLPPFPNLSFTPDTFPPPLLLPGLPSVPSVRKHIVQCVRIRQLFLFAAPYFSIVMKNIKYQFLNSQSWYELLQNTSWLTEFKASDLSLVKHLRRFKYIKPNSSQHASRSSRNNMMTAERHIGVLDVGTGDSTNRLKVFKN